MDLSKKREREKLVARREPYWQQLQKGRYLGFRRGPETWIARYRDRSGKQNYQALEVTDFGDAKKAAEEWFQQMGTAGARTAKNGTVRDGLEAYVAWLKNQGRESAARTALQRFEAIVWPDPLAGLKMQMLSREDMKEWRDRQRGYWTIRCACGVERRITDDAQEPRCTKCRTPLDVAEKRWRERQPRSVNRHVRGVVAGLNRAVADGHLGNPDAWKLDPLADDQEDSETAVMLTAAQRTALIAAVEPETGNFLRGLAFTGARPGELAAACVRDLDGDMLTLRHRKGRPPKLRARAVVLSDDAVMFFAKQARNKTPSAPLFSDPDGKPWDRHVWAKTVRKGITSHNAKAQGPDRIPHDASAYSFRHARISELLQVHGVDPLTVAQQTGTSLRMIEKAYFRFIAGAMRDKLRAAS